jgi:signal transduction histidine kinase
MLKTSGVIFLFCFFLISTYSQPNNQPNNQTLFLEFYRLDSLCKVSDENNLALVISTSKRMAEIGSICQVDTFLLKANYHQAVALSQLGSLQSALKISYDNLVLAEQKNIYSYLMNYSFLIGSVYQSMQDWENAQIFFKKAKLYAINYGRVQDTITINYEIAFNLVAGLGKATEGIAMMQQNLQAARLTDNKAALLSGIDNLSNILAERGDDKQALAVELELLKMPEIWDTNLEKTAINEHFSEIYVKLKDWDNAQKYQKECLKYAILINSNDWLFECYKLQALIDEGRGNYKSAYQNHKMYLALKDSVYQSQYDEKMSAMSAVYELDAKQKAISILEKDQQIKSDQIENQRFIMLLGLLSFGLVVLGIRFWNQRKTTKLKEVFAQDLIKSQETERQRISKELHDSVGQNILFIKNRLQRLFDIPDAQLMQSVNTALEEVRTIAKDLYPNQLELHGLNAAVDALCELVHESSGVFVSSDLQGIDARLNKEAKINCYRIIQECINNTLKHAEASAIRITSNLQTDKIELIVQDNGKGFDKGQLGSKSVKSFGLINIEERIKMLRGKLDIETSLNKGVKLTFAIPTY